MPARKNKNPAAGNADYVELDKVGEVDEDVEQMAEIELSSDEEDDEDDCALIVLKRPPVTERTVEEIEVENQTSSMTFSHHRIIESDMSLTCRSS